MPREDDKECQGTLRGENAVPSQGRGAGLQAED